MEIKFNKVSLNLNGKKILQDINLNILEGKINAIIGPSGSGKTIIMDILYGVKNIDNGYISVGDLILDKDISKDNIREVRKRIGFVFQVPDKTFFFHSVKQELEYTLEQYNYPLEKVEKRIQDALKLVELSKDFLTRDPLTLSSGEKRQLALANALLLNPKILVMDEPTIGLDVKDKKNLVKILKTIKRKYGKTIIILTKDTDFIHQFTDYIFVLNFAKIQIAGDKYTVFKQKEILYKNNIEIPKIIDFELLALEKKIKLGYRDEINDLIKDILRNT